jgi:hypothetical protein
MALALAGLAIAIGVAVLATNLASQQIGIAAESVSAGDALAPALRPHRTDRTRRTQRRDERDERPAAVPEPPGQTEASPPPSEGSKPRSDAGGEDSGGEGGDD